MRHHVKPLISYWRKSILDSVAAPGALSEVPSEYWRISTTALESDKLPDEILERWQKFIGKRDQRTIAIIPKIYQKQIVHGQRSTCGEPQIILPLYLPCLASKTGNLTLLTRTLPIIPRDILEPLDDKEGLVIGTMDNFSQAVEELVPTSCHSLSLFQKQGLKLLDHVAPEFDATMERLGYTLMPYGYLHSNFQPSMAAKIITLCDCILRDIERKDGKNMPLLRTIAVGEHAERPLPPISSSFSNRLGYPNHDHALADNQRLAATCLLETREGEVLAINGPPGTGKTAVLLSLIATETIRAVLDGSPHPPIIVAASTNNQAVTNILDAFASIPSQDGLYKRWISLATSFGSYYAATGKKVEAQKRGILTENFFTEARKIHASLKQDFLQSFAAFSGSAIPLNAVPDRIRNTLEQEKAKLERFERDFAALETQRKKLGDAVDGVNEQVLRESLGQVRECITQWRETYIKRSLGEKLFGWFGSIRTKVEKRMSNVYDEYWPAIFRQAFPYPHSTFRSFPEEADSFRISLRHYLDALENCRKLIREWTGREWEEPSLIAADRLFDSTIRRTMFWLAVHYWEARWLIETETPRQREWEKDTSAFMKEWRERMMLTPCAAATFHQLAGLMTVWNPSPKPQYNAIDLLIVEEAGQVSPELAGPSFSLAKRAVIVGDALQIEPVWSVNAAIDKGNAKSENFEYQELVQKGQASSSGSVIKMAQATTAFSQDFTASLGAAKASKLGRGLYLVEHRRCITPIITYCNRLCYEGILQPKNDKTPRTDMLPMFGVQVGGTSIRPATGSRYNEQEAQAVASWLNTNRMMLQKEYGATLEEIVGIVTPFKAQISKINQALKDQGISGITVGTVHALQGAERSIILFSPVCTQADAQERLFFNSSPNMLNVAVSRAKENFIIFGDMVLMALVDPHSPYGQFANYLKFDASLLNEHQAFPAELRPTCFLQDMEKHDAFLSCVFKNARKTIVIVSPWVTESVVRLFFNEIEKSVKNGVAVHVVVDPQKCSGSANNGLPLLERTGATIHESNVDLHAKLLFCDDHTVACGSFNWLSANRGEYRQVEQSAVVDQTNKSETLRDFCERCKIRIE